MPEYIFKHPDREEYKAVFFHMNDDKKHIDQDDVEWKRVFTSSQLNTTGADIDPWNKNQFVEKTGKQKGTYGDLLDRSAELSQKRADQNGGVDPVKQKHFDSYAKKRGGIRHSEEKSKKIETKNIRIDL
jgi:hypothetical protein|tara:strand:+ start:905 stop:1291 length:387 start_codon:yes stop_codon:yes gene_type:complete